MSEQRVWNDKYQRWDWTDGSLKKDENDDQMRIFTDRELRLIENCKSYTSNNPAGLPGRNLMIIISKLVDIMDVLVPLIANEEVEIITRHLVGKYGIEGEQGRDPGQALFEQIKDMVKARTFVRRDMIRPRRTAEEIAESQGRDMIYICPDRTFRNNRGEIIGEKGDSLHGGPYADCIPFSFGDEDNFKDWLNEVIDG